MSEVPCRVLESMLPERFAPVRRRAIFECFKWDPQVGDVATLAPFALQISKETWRELAGWAEQLAGELMEAEQALWPRGDLHKRLGLPARIRRILRRHREQGPSPGVARVIRFDFHYTTEGWKISEANVDVPGGFNEAAGVARLMAEQYPGLEPCGDPSEAIAQALVSAGIPAGSLVALVHATAYTDDRQVMLYLEKNLQARGYETCLLAPQQVDWNGARACTDWIQAPLAAILRFFPAEWLVHLGASRRWAGYYSGSPVPLCNPASALLVQSKRLPLVWDELGGPMRAWRKLLPETRDPANERENTPEKWVIKPALGRVGEGIGMHGITEPKEWRDILRAASRTPGEWILQRRFRAIPIETKEGLRYPCFGVYTVSGQACGIYGRLGKNPLVDGKALDVAVLKAASAEEAKEGIR